MVCRVAHSCGAIIFRGYRNAIERRGHLEAVIERVRPSTQQLLRNPPMAIGWVDYDDMNEVFRALGEKMTRLEVRQAGYEAAREGIGPIIAPVIRGTLGLFGASPQGLFGNLRRVTGVVLKSTDFVFTSTGPRAGTMEVINPIPMDPSLYVGWEGAFLFGFEVLGIKGVVGQAEVLDGGKRARVPISW